MVYRHLNTDDKIEITLSVRLHREDYEGVLRKIHITVIAKIKHLLQIARGGAKSEKTDSSNQGDYQTS